MHDIKSIRDNPQAFDAGLKRRGLAPLSASLLAIDEKRRAAILASEQAQARRIQRHAVLQKAFTSLPLDTPGGQQTLQCLKLSLLPLWLSGIQASRVKPELQQRLEGSALVQTIGRIAVIYRPDPDKPQIELP